MNMRKIKGKRLCLLTVFMGSSQSKAELWGTFQLGYRHVQQSCVFFLIFLRACVSREKSFMFLVRGGVEGKMGRYNIPPHPQQC